MLLSGKEKLRYGNEEVRVVLESDGTEVDDEEYFQFLEAQTTFIFLTQDDGEWMPAYGRYFITTATNCHDTGLTEIILTYSMYFAKLWVDGTKLVGRWWGRRGRLLERLGVFNSL